MKIKKSGVSVLRTVGLSALPLSLHTFSTPSAVLQSLTRFAILCLLLALVSCKEKNTVETSFAIPENAVSIEEQAIAQNEATSAKSATASDGTKIDYDLSEMNSNMVYAEVFNMMIEPDFYVGKVIKMRGNLAVYPNSPTANGGNAYAIIISDALACCKQGIEFKCPAATAEKLPKDGEIVTVTGVYTSGMLPGDIAYNYVKADSVEM